MRIFYLFIDEFLFGIFLKFEKLLYLLQMKVKNLFAPIFDPILKIQKILTIGLVNFVRVDQSLQLHMIFPTLELEIQPLWAGRV